jgi:excisionase family DNA binding protein
VREALLDVKEVSGLLHVHPKTIYGWKASNKLPSVMVNGRVLFDKKGLDEFIERRRGKFIDPEALLQKVILPLDTYDRLHLKGESALSKNSRRWSYGFGSVYQRGSKRGREHWYVDYLRQGKRVREVVKGARDRADALAFLQKKISETFAGNPRSSGQPLRFNAFADMYVTKYAQVEKRSWKTDKAYIENSMKPFFRDAYLADIKPLDVQELVQARLAEGVTKATVNRGLQILKRMFNVAADWGYSSENPVTKVRLFSEKGNKKERILTADEERALMETCSEHLRPIVIMALNSGMRRGEILKLKWAAVDFDKRIVRVEETKSGEPRKVDMNRTAFELLTRQRILNPAGECVWTNPDTGKAYVEVGKAFRAACRRAGIKGLRFHDLRHTFASRLIEAGADIITVRDLLGHSSVKLTERYTHSSGEQKRRAVDLLVERNAEIPSQIRHKNELTNAFSVN